MQYGWVYISTSHRKGQKAYTPHKHIHKRKSRHSIKTHTRAHTCKPKSTNLATGRAMMLTPGTHLLCLCQRDLGPFGKLCVWVCVRVCVGWGPRSEEGWTVWESHLFTADKVRATKGKSPLPYAEKERERYIERKRWTEGGEEQTNFSTCFLFFFIIHKLPNM